MLLITEVAKTTMNSITNIFLIISNFLVQLFHNVQSFLSLGPTEEHGEESHNSVSEQQQEQPQLNKNGSKWAKSNSRSKKHLNSSELVDKTKMKPLKKMPGPLSLPFFGTMLTAPYKHDLKAANKYFVDNYGEVVKLEYYRNYPIVLVYNADDIEHIIKVASIIRPPLQIIALYRSPRKDRYESLGLANSNGEDWTILRSLVEPQLYNTVYNRKLTADCVQISEDFIQLLSSFMESEIQDFADFVFRFNFECACLLILGKRVSVLDPKCENKLNVFIDACPLFFKTLSDSFAGFPLFPYYPDRIWRNFEKVEGTMYDTFSEVVDEMKESGELGGLLSHFFETENNKASYKDRRTLGMDLILGALEPVHNTTLFAIYLIASNEKVSEKLFEELYELIPTKDAIFDEETLDRMSYLKACIQESYRFMPTAARLARIVETDVVLQGFHIPPYTLFMCQHWHASLQDSNFYRATEFLPERWIITEQDGKRSTPFTPHSPKLLYNFGIGKRDCPGRKFMQVQLAAVLAKLFRNFIVQFPQPMEITFEYLLSPVFPVPVKLTPRSD